MSFFFSKSRMPNAKYLALLLLLLPLPAHAQGAAPAMYGVREVVIQLPRFGNEQTAASCDLDANALMDIIEKTLTENGVPAVSVTEAKPAMAGVARINLIPDVFSFNSQGLDCTSWIWMSAESRNSVRIPPIDTSRNVTITYWHEGTMLASNQTTHQGVVGDTMRKLAIDFAKQYKLDQPPSLSKQ